MGRMATLEPYFVACTWGAGGSTQQRTLEVCSTAQSVYGLETLMHLTCTNMEKEKIDRALEVGCVCVWVCIHSLIPWGTLSLGC